MCSAIGWKWGRTVVPVAGFIPRLALGGVGAFRGEWCSGHHGEALAKHVMPAGLYDGYGWCGFGHGTWWDTVLPFQTQVYAHTCLRACTYGCAYTHRESSNGMIALFCTFNQEDKF